jgi:hypothetical protein
MDYVKIVNEFFINDADARDWTSNPDTFREAPDCDVMAGRFLRHLMLRGISARVVQVKVTADDPMTDVHYFTVIDDGVAFDFTARQFYSLDGMPLTYDEIPCPLVFLYPGPYPLPTIHETEEVTT